MIEKRKKKKEKIAPELSDEILHSPSTALGINVQGEPFDSAQGEPFDSAQGEPQTMDDLLKSTGYNLRGFKRGDTVEGMVASITPSEILIDIGYKSFGVISEREMDNVGNLHLKVNDKILVQIVSPESEAGQLILSVRRAGMDKKWQELKEFKNKNEIVEVTGQETIRGGLLVDYQGIRGFIPASQMNQGQGNIQLGVGQKIKVMVIEIDKANNRLVFSEKKAGQPERKALKAKALAKIKIGETYEGKINGIVPFGLFVEIEDTEGLVHISEIAWEKVVNPGDYFKVGDRVKVLIISIDQEAGKLNLSIKQLSKDPWYELVKKYSPEQEIDGRVVKISNFGVFVELEKGVDGLIHISKIPPGHEFKEGEKVKCTIEGIDIQKRKISLGMVLKEKPVGYR